MGQRLSRSVRRRSQAGTAPWFQDQRRLYAAVWLTFAAKPLHFHKFTRLWAEFKRCVFVDPTGRVSGKNGMRPLRTRNWFQIAVAASAARTRLALRARRRALGRGGTGVEGEVAGGIVGEAPSDSVRLWLRF